MGDCCEDNRFVLIERAKQDFIENTNLSDAELAVLDRMCFRMWQMGLLEKYEERPEKKAIDIEKGKVFIKDLLISIIGHEPKEGWIEDIQNNYVKAMEE